ncbi:hypothetical protein GCM10007094_08570 [Pseudovibrio japonicus]|uniref:Uncharacterized protein n=1 Tax=Pseudovibrio japonicus TaxID=366534 RepID=A0ABQ3E0V0_9HYPH|nr:hypothetical protein GCM10007094_08570 [Pseudovibrio japonicus]
MNSSFDEGRAEEICGAGNKQADPRMFFVSGASLSGHEKCGPAGCEQCVKQITKFCVPQFEGDFNALYWARVAAFIVSFLCLWVINVRTCQRKTIRYVSLK